MEGLSRWVVRHRMVVSLLWLAITVVGVLVAPTVSAHLKSGVHVDSAAYTANQQIARQYGGGYVKSGHPRDQPAERSDR